MLFREKPVRICIQSLALKIKFKMQEDFYQRIFRDRNLRRLADYHLPFQGELPTHTLMHDEPTRCRVINHLTYNDTESRPNRDEIRKGLGALCVEQC